MSFSTLLKIFIVSAWAVIFSAIVVCTYNIQTGQESEPTDSFKVRLYTDGNQIVNTWDTKLVRKDNNIELHDVKSGYYIVIENTKEEFIKLK